MNVEKLSELVLYALKDARTRTAGRLRVSDRRERGDYIEIDFEPADRRREDSYSSWDDDDEDDWGSEDLWGEEYAYPLKKEVMKRLREEIGTDMVKKAITVNIGEKGHVEVAIRKSRVSQAKTGTSLLVRRVIERYLSQTTGRS